MRELGMGSINGRGAGRWATCRRIWLKNARRFFKVFHSDKISPSCFQSSLMCLTIEFGVFLFHSLSKRINFFLRKNIEKIFFFPPGNLSSFTYIIRQSLLRKLIAFSRLPHIYLSTDVNAGIFEITIDVFSFSEKNEKSRRNLIE